MTEPFADAYNKALDALARRMRSTHELERWLMERDYAPETVSAVMLKLTALGLLNDGAYTRLFVRTRLERGLSRRRIQAELFRRGIGREMVETTLADVMADEQIDERATVESVARKKLRSLAKLPTDVQRRRLYGFLARRGYSADLIQGVVRQLVRSAAESTD